MSHVATNWAFSQTGLRPAEKLLLLCLADRHNPDLGCFPSQDRLAGDAGMSRASVNDNLARLEARGLIRREQRLDPRTKRQQPTRYILGFEDCFTQEPCPESGHGIAGTEAEHKAEPCPENGHGPCPDSGPTRVQNLDTNLVREPVREEEERAGARDDFREMVREIAEALGDPEIAERTWWAHEAEHGHRIAAWRALGLSDVQILEVARQHGLDYPDPPRGPKALDRAMGRAAAKAAKNGAARPRAGTAEVVDYWRGLLASDRYIAPSALTSTTRRLLIAKGVATHESLRARGL